MARILLLLPEAFATGGIQAYGRLLIKGFRQLASDRAGSCDVLLLKDRPEALDARYLGPGPGRVVASGGSRLRFVGHALSRILAARPDLVVVGHLNFAPLALAIRALHPRGAQWLVAYGVEAWRRLGPIPRRALARARRITAISEFTRANLARHNGIDPGRIHVLTAALDPVWLERFGSSAAPEPDRPPRPTLLTVARLDASEAYKGIEHVLQALPAIADKLPDLRYVVVGEGTDRSRLQGLARELGLASRVEFRGTVAFEALAKAYAECDLFVMPSGGEGFGIVFLEAALFGKPSVACRDGGAADAIEDGASGVLVRPGDTRAIADAILTLLPDRARLAEMGARARRRLLERFSYDAFASNLAAHASALLPAPAPAGRPS